MSVNLKYSNVSKTSKTYRNAFSSTDRQDNSSNSQAYFRKKPPQMFSFAECIPWITVGLAESVAIVTINLIAIIVFLKNRNLRKRSTYLMINLGIVDMLAGGSAVVNLFYFAGHYYCNLWNWYSSGSEDWVYLCIVFTFENLFPVASLINITAIALERFHATFSPHRYRVLNKGKYTIVIAAVWITGGLFHLASIVLIKFALGSYYLHLRNSFILICLLIICTSYARIVIKVRCGVQPQHHGVASRERKLTMTLLIATVISLLFYLPDVIFHVVDLASSNSQLISKYVRLHGVLNFLFYTNSLVNPILYAARMPDFRRALVALFRRRPQQLNQAPVLPFQDM